MERPVKSVKEIKQEMDAVKFGDDVSITFLRGSATQTVTVHIPKELESSDL